MLNSKEKQVLEHLESLFGKTLVVGSSIYLSTKVQDMDGEPTIGSLIGENSNDIDVVIENPRATDKLLHLTLDLVMLTGMQVSPKLLGNPDIGKYDNPAIVRRVVMEIPGTRPFDLLFCSNDANLGTKDSIGSYMAYLPWQLPKSFNGAHTINRVRVRDLRAKVRKDLERFKCMGNTPRANSFSKYKQRVEKLEKELKNY